jgi:hypothetical protein
MMQHGETIHSMLPWDIPWWMPDHAVFMGVLYLALGVIGAGVTFVVAKSLIDTKRGHGAGHH